MFSSDSMKCNDVFTLFIRHLVSREDLLTGILNIIGQNNQYCWRKLPIAKTIKIFFKTGLLIVELNWRFICIYILGYFGLMATYQKLMSINEVF